MDQEASQAVHDDHLTIRLRAETDATLHEWDGRIRKQIGEQERESRAERASLSTSIEALSKGQSNATEHFARQKEALEAHMDTKMQRIEDQMRDIAAAVAQANEAGLTSSAELREGVDTTISAIVGKLQEMAQETSAGLQAAQEVYHNLTMTLRKA